MKNTKTKMEYLSPSARIKNFAEVALGFTKEQAMLEANRCLECRHMPCVKGCPVGIDIPGFIKKIKEDDLSAAYNILVSQNSFPGICGRVCPQETQCELECVRAIKGEPVAIGDLERYISDNKPLQFAPKTNQVKKLEKIAVIGSGPAGLACSGELAKLGYDVHLFEALHLAGGVLIYGIPEFRLPSEIVNKEIKQIKELGVKIHLNTIIGKTKSIEDLFREDFKAIFISSGAGQPRFMNIPGENLNGVYSANEILTRINLMKAYDEKYDTPLNKLGRVIVVGGGNVAMDAARSARRLNASEVILVYRRSREELPARVQELKHAEEEGIKFIFQANPVEILGSNGNVEAIECLKMDLIKANSSRKIPVEIKNSNFKIVCDTVIMALGNHSNPLISRSNPDLQTDEFGCFIVDENLETSISNVYAGGDVVTGAATVIEAMGAGKRAAIAINNKLRAGK